MSSAAAKKNVVRFHTSCHFFKTKDGYQLKWNHAVRNTKAPRMGQPMFASYLYLQALNRQCIHVLFGASGSSA